MRDPLADVPGSVGQLLQGSLFQRVVVIGWLASVERPQFILNDGDLLVVEVTVEGWLRHLLLSLQVAIYLISLFLGEVTADSTLKLNNGDEMMLIVVILRGSLQLALRFGLLATAGRALAHL